MEQFQLRWQKTCKVQSYQVDLHQRMSVPALCNFFQELAWEHAEHLNFGFNHLKSIGKFWVLSRLQMKIYKYPLWGDEILFSTWPRGMDGLLALREFLVLSANGEKLAAATTSWLVLDEEKHRPQRIDPIEFARFSQLTDSVLDISAEKIAKPEQATKVESFKVKFSDIDVNRHVNNVRFMQWAIDAIPFNELMSKRVGEFSINFIAEARLEDSITIWLNCGENSYNVVLVNESKEKEMCRISMIMK